MKHIKLKIVTISVLLIASIFSCVKEPINNTIEINNSIDTLIATISYGINQKQVYDIYLPAGRGSNTPVLLLVHGGAWKGGQKEDFNNYISLIKKHWKEVAIINMNYRLASNSNNIHHHEIISDINTAITHVLNNKTKYQISSKMGIIGASAGGQLAMIYAYKYNNHNNIKCVGNIFGPSIISDWSWYNSTNLWLGSYVGNILTEYVGQPWNKTIYDDISPYWNITSKSQPTIIFHGNLDPIVPVYQSQWMHGKLNSLNVTNQYYEYTSFHGFDDTQSVDLVVKLSNFFKVYLN